MVLPNILIVGTPGVGKSSLCKKLVERLGDEYEWHNVSKIAIEHNFTSGFDEVFNCPTLDESRLLDFLEPEMAAGGNIVEYHSCDFFPERWFDLVFVVRCNNTLLYDRLEARNYSEKKIKSNVECEIFQTILEEARDSYKPDIVHELRSETDEDMDSNLDTICGHLNVIVASNRAN